MSRVGIISTNPLPNISEQEDDVDQNGTSKLEAVKNQVNIESKNIEIGRKMNSPRMNFQTEEDKEKTIVFLKSVWYLVSLAVMMVIASIIFMGIEGIKTCKISFI